MRTTNTQRNYTKSKILKTPFINLQGISQSRFRYKKTTEERIKRPYEPSSGKKKKRINTQKFLSPIQNE